MGCVMNNEWVRFFRIGAMVLGLLLCLVGLIRLNNPWWLRTAPPAPPHAMHLKTAYLRDYTSVADGTRRETQFEIDQPDEAVRTFYQAQLTKRGWTYQGAVRPQCESRMLLPVPVVDVYDRDGRTLTVQIMTPEATQNRQVHVVEYQGTLTYPIQQTPVANTAPTEAVIGDWQAIGESGARTFLLCLYEQGAVSLFVTGTHAFNGMYQWVDEGIRLILDMSKPFAATDPGRENDAEFCSHLPALFSGDCQATLFNPAAYPGPDRVIRPTPTSAPPSKVPPYPPVTEFMHIDGIFAVTIEGNTLTLTSPSGVTRTFRRLMQEHTAMSSRTLIER